MNKSIDKTSFDSHEKEMKDALHQLRSEFKSESQETSRVVKELHDQVYEMNRTIGAIPGELKEKIMEAIDSRFVTKERYSPVEKIVFGAIKTILIGVLTITGAAVLYYLSIHKP